MFLELELSNDFEFDENLDFGNNQQMSEFINTIRTEFNNTEELDVLNRKIKKISEVYRKGKYPEGAWDGVMEDLMNGELELGGLEGALKEGDPSWEDRLTPSPPKPKPPRKPKTQSSSTNTSSKAIPDRITRSQSTPTTERSTGTQSTSTKTAETSLQASQKKTSNLVSKPTQTSELKPKSNLTIQGKTDLTFPRIPSPLRRQEGPNPQ